LISSPQSNGAAPLYLLDMKIEEILHSFVLLGKKISSIDRSTFASLSEKAGNQNPWFTKESITIALTGVSKLLHEQALNDWIKQYSWVGSTKPKTIALILAGNIPLVGFHDILTVLMSGNKALIKTSAKDTVLIDFVVSMLGGIEPRLRAHITFAQTLRSFDAVIATGSDNSSRYFEYYFGKYPSIIRKNRTSCAVLNGGETDKDLIELGRDVFTYYGLGCRNVSKLFVFPGFDFSRLMDAWKSYGSVIHHHKYCNNYDYQKAILLVNNTPFLDNGFVLLTPVDRLVSPIGVVYYEEYKSDKELQLTLDSTKEKIQCVIGSRPPATIPFGEAQFPGPGDYADNIDTLQFLINLN
jgi:Acyl-CoA reductase (LuxC)